MATYNYQCQDCGKKFEIEASIKEKEAGRSEKFACLGCRSKNIKPEFSTVNFIRNIFKSDKKADGCCSGEKVSGTGCGCEPNPDDRESDRSHKGCGCS